MHWFGSLLSGGKAVLLKGTRPEFILETVSKEKCTIVWLLVPWAQDILEAIESGKVDLKEYIDFRYNESLKEVEILDTDSKETAEKRRNKWSGKSKQGYCKKLQRSC